MARNQAASLIGYNSLINTFQSITDNWSTPNERQVVAGAPYSAYVEFGTWSMAAQPFMRPAIDGAVGRAGNHARSANNVNQLLELLAIDIRDHAKTYAAVDTGRMRDEIHIE